MSDTAAAFCDFPSFDGRSLTRGGYRRVARIAGAIGDGVVVGAGTVAAAGVLVAAVTLTAAWLVNTALSANPHLHARAPVGRALIALADPTPEQARAIAVADLGPAPGDPVEAQPVTFAAKWALTMAPASPSANVVAVVPQHAMRRADVTPLLPPKAVAEHADSVPLPQPHPLNAPQTPAEPEIARAPVVAPAPQVAAAIVPPPAPAPEKRVAPAPAHNKMAALPGPESRTAVYDISARTVYLPNGEKLEAHSGLYEKMDDPRYVNVKMRGPTPPNVYELTLREQLFHGVRALRLNPVDESKMFGRDGMLAHTYMLGPNGQSNGCVSFRDYDKFLHAYLRGEVDRLVVVPRLGDTPLRTAARAQRGSDGRYAANDPAAPPRALTW